jgi:hypothetical protein
MKTVKDYLNDPRLVNDPDMQDVPACIKEVHAIRLKLQDEHDVLSPEYADYCHKRTQALFAESGITPRYATL